MWLRKMLLSAVQTLHCLRACLSYPHLPLCACQADMLGALIEQSNLGRVGLTTARPSCTVPPSHCSPCLTLSVAQQISGLRGGAREIPEEHVIVGRVRLHAGARERGVAERAVRLEERVAQQDVLVVLVAEHAVLRRDEALRRGCPSCPTPESVQTALLGFRHPSLHMGIV